MKIMCVVANGSEDCELITVVDLLRRASIEALYISVDDICVTLARGTKMYADDVIENVDVNSFDGIFLPGGLKGFERFKSCDYLLDIIRKFDKSNKLVSAICAAPGVLDKAGVLINHDYTMFSGMEKDNKDGNYIDTGCVISGNIITGKSLNYSVDLGLELVKYLEGEETLNKVKKGIIRL